MCTPKWYFPPTQINYIDGHNGDYDNSIMHGCNTSTMSISSLNSPIDIDNARNLCNKGNDDDPLQI